jgi:hypothetical protein
MRVEIVLAVMLVAVTPVWAQSESCRAGRVLTQQEQAALTPEAVPPAI